MFDCGKVEIFRWKSATLLPSCDFDSSCTFKMIRDARYMFFATLALILITSVVSEELYSSKFDDVDVDQILRTPRLRKQYENCLLNVSPCVTPDAKFMKNTFPEALVTKCRRCTEKQKILFEKVTLWYTQNDTETWNKILMTSINAFRT